MEALLPKSLARLVTRASSQLSPLGQRNSIVTTSKSAKSDVHVMAMGDVFVFTHLHITHLCVIDLNLIKMSYFTSTGPLTLSMM